MQLGIFLLIIVMFMAAAAGLLVVGEVKSKTEKIGYAILSLVALAMSIFSFLRFFNFQ